MTERVMIVVWVSACLVGLVAAFQVMGRASADIPTEAPLRPLVSVGHKDRARTPPELAALEQLVQDTLRGDHAAAARLAAHLRGVGVRVADGPPATVLAALAELVSQPAQH